MIAQDSAGSRQDARGGIAAGSGNEIIKLTMREDDLVKLNGRDSIAFSTDGTRVAYVSEGGKVHICETNPIERVHLA